MPKAIRIIKVCSYIIYIYLEYEYLLTVHCQIQLPICVFFSQLMLNALCMNVNAFSADFIKKNPSGGVHTEEYL